MPTGEIVLASDNELAIKAGLWAREKLLYIEGICAIFNQGMKNRWQIRSYIDLFSGPGKCIIEDSAEEIPGSPVLALIAPTPFTHYFFNDTDSRLIRALQTRAANLTSAQVKYYHKDCNEVIDDLLRNLPQSSLDLCFIDPLNWEISFDSIRRLTQNRRMDLAITFHIGNIKRWAARPSQRLINFFPDQSWLQKYHDARTHGRPTGRILLDSYEKGLRSIGYNFIRDGVLERNRKNVPLYHIIFASKHSRGSDFWDKITSRLGTGQIRMPIQELR